MHTMMTEAKNLNNTIGKDCYEKPNHKKKGNINKSHAKPDTKTSIKDWCFYIGSVNHASDYGATSQFIMNHAKKICVRGNDTHEALRTNMKPDVSKWEAALKLGIPRK